MERIDLVAGRVRPKITDEALGFYIAVPAEHRNSSIVSGDDVVHAILPLLPQGTVQRIDTDESYIGLEPSDADLMWNQVQPVHRPGVAIEDTETIASGKSSSPVVGPVPLEFPVERKHAHVVRENLFNQQVDDSSGKITSPQGG